MATDLRKPTHNETKEHNPQAGQLTQVQPKTVSTQLAAHEGGIQGEVDSSDFQKPFLGIAQGVGFGPEHGWRPGDIVLGKEYGLFRPQSSFDKGTDPLRVIVVRGEKVFIERLPQGSKETPRTFKSLQNALDCGLRSSWGTSGDRTKDKPTVEPQLNTGILIAKNGNSFNQKGEKIVVPNFNFELNGELYAPALWSISGTAYTSAAKALFTFSKDRPLYSFEVWLSSKLITGENTYASPIVKRVPI